MNTFYMDIEKIQPSQLYISRIKLSKIMEWLNPNDLNSFSPIPIKELDGKVIFTDGHTRAWALYTLGIKKAPVYYDMDEMDWEAYQICVDECIRNNIHTISDLKDRLVSYDEYKVLWHDWCDKMHKELELKRKD